LGFSALGQMDVRRAARPLMQELSEYTKASVHLAVSDRLWMQVVDTYWHSASFIIDIGSRIPIATTSIGRAYVCALLPAEQTKILDEIREARPADWSVAKEWFDQAFSDYAEYGVCFGLGNWRREVNAVAAPLVLRDGPGPVVIGCSGASFQLEPERLKHDIGPRLLGLISNVRASLLNS
jgi:DNA-binding IclR family transcriptional regulator